MNEFLNPYCVSYAPTIRLTKTVLLLLFHLFLTLFCRLTDPIPTTETSIAPRQRPKAGQTQPNPGILPIQPALTPRKRPTAQAAIQPQGKMMLSVWCLPAGRCVPQGCGAHWSNGSACLFGWVFSPLSVAGPAALGSGQPSLPASVPPQKAAPQQTPAQPQAKQAPAPQQASQAQPQVPSTQPQATPQHQQQLFLKQQQLLQQQQQQQQQAAYYQQQQMMQAQQVGVHGCVCCMLPVLEACKALSLHLWQVPWFWGDRCRF